MHRLLLVSFTVFLISGLVSCATGSKQLVGVHAALTEAQNGKSEQGRAALDKLCEKGSTGACAINGRPVELVKPLSIMQSVTSNSQARFVVVVPRHETLEYYVRAGDSITKLTPERTDKFGTRQVVDEVEAFHLDTKTTYELIVIASDGMVWDKRNFRALDLNRRRVRMAVVTGLDDQQTALQQRMWTQLKNQRPDVVLMAGNTVYGEKDSTPESLYKRYLSTRESLSFFTSNPLVPVMATWNDRDYGKNDGDRTYSAKSDAADIFFTFFAQKKAAPGLEPGPGISGWWSAFGVHFALLDNRTFRSQNGVELPDQTHFGADQETWLVGHMKLVHEPVFLVSGDQFFGGYQHLESYEGNHPKSFAQQLTEWKKTPAPVLFISGDRHLMELLKVPGFGYSTYELTAAPMHAEFGSGVIPADPNQVVGAENKNGYLMLELIRSERGFLQFDVQSFGEDRKQLFQKTLTVKHS